MSDVRFSIRRGISRKERGAAMVEFAVSIVGLLMLVAVIVDGCLLFHRYSLLTESATELARKVSSDIARSPMPSGLSTDGACAELCTRANRITGEFTTGEIIDDTFLLTPKIIPSGGDFLSYAPYPLIKVEASGEARCLFCSLVPWSIPIRAVSLLVIESATTGCIGEGERICS